MKVGNDNALIDILIRVPSLFIPWIVDLPDRRDPSCRDPIVPRASCRGAPFLDSVPTSSMSCHVLNRAQDSAAPDRSPALQCFAILPGHTALSQQNHGPC